MKHWLKTFLLVIVTLLGAATLPAMAASEDAAVDARLANFAETKDGKTTQVSVQVDARNPTYTWLLFGFLAALSIAAMFKNAKRTHLD